MWDTPYRPELQPAARVPTCPLLPYCTFQAVWRERRLGSDADAAQAEMRFKVRLSKYRAGHCATPEEWLLPGSCLVEALGL